MDIKKDGANVSAAEKAKMLDGMEIGFSSRQVASEEEIIADYLEQATENLGSEGKEKELLLAGMDIGFRSRQVATEEQVEANYIGETEDKTELLNEMEIGFRSEQIASEEEIVAKYSVPESSASSSSQTAAPSNAGKEAAGSVGPKTLESPVAINSLNTLVIPSLYELTSDFAQRQFLELVRQLAEAPFIMAMISTFGTDIPVEAFQNLYRDASDNKIINPYIFVSEDYIEGHLAGFDQSTQEILVAEPFLRQAINDNEKKAQLFAALIEEYGHYLDYLLRNSYSTVGGDAEGDEGARFSYNLILWEVFQQENIEFAEVLSLEFSGMLVLDNKDLSKALASVDISEQIIDNKIDHIEFFGAGTGDSHNPASYGHQSIEYVLADVGFDPVKELPRIYFGNWLRDFSQMVDPAIVRPAGEALRRIQKDPKRAAQMDTMRLSRKAITRFIGLLAAKEFGRFDKTWAKSIYQNMTPKILGVYRPEEHIDNPKGLGDSSYIDPDFVDSPTAAQLAINPATGLKNYIATATPGQRFPSSLDYMVSELNLAMQAGRTDDGFRHFGQALHVLEDFYSHSNYVELAIIKMGHQNKFATPELNELARKVQSRVDVQGNPDTIPLVTGRFGQFDVLASVGPKFSALFDIKIEDYLSDKQEAKAKRAEADLAILILLEDLAEAQQADTTQSNKNYLGVDYAELLADFRWFIGVREELIKQKEDFIPGLVLKACYYLVSAVIAISNASIYLIAEVISHSIDDAQTVLDKAGTDPTHSQLAKDHDDHPLHDLAAQLAKSAVRLMGEKLNAYWNSKVAFDPAQEGRKFFRHPRDFVLSEDIIIPWVNSHAAAIQQATYPTVLHEAHHHMEKAKDEITKHAVELYKQYNSVRDYFGF